MVKQTKVSNSYYCVKYLVSTSKTIDKQYRTQVLHVIDHPYKARYEVMWDAPVAEHFNKTWLGAMINHYREVSHYKEIADKF